MKITEAQASGLQIKQTRCLRYEVHMVQNFVEMNPCSGDKAKEQYHRLRSLVCGIVVKSYIHHVVA